MKHCLCFVLFLILIGSVILGSTKWTTAAEGFATRFCYSLSKGAISRKEARTLTNVINAHPYVKENTSLNSDGFKNTKGFVLHFTALAAEKVFSEDKYLAPFAEYFVKMYEQIGEEGNAFVMNVLVCPKNKTGIDFHQDNTLDLAKGTSNKDYDPNKVAILYAQMPPEGGEIEICTTRNLEGPPTAKDTVMISPQAGDILVFDGLLYHKVHPHNSDKPRISIVLEAYDVSPKDLKKFVPIKKMIAGKANTRTLDVEEDSDKDDDEDDNAVYDME